MIGEICPRVLKDTIEAFEGDNPGALLVGSLARASYFKTLGDQDYEYRLRGQPTLSKTYVWGVGSRDLDYVTPKRGNGEIRSGTFKVDTFCFKQDCVEIFKDGDWWIVSKRFGIEERLDEAVLEPNDRLTVYDIPCTVPPIATLYAMVGLCGSRNKEQITGPLLEARFPNETCFAMESDMYRPLREIRDRLMIK